MIVSERITVLANEKYDIRWIWLRRENSVGMGKRGLRELEDLGGERHKGIRVLIRSERHLQSARVLIALTQTQGPDLNFTHDLQIMTDN